MMTDLIYNHVERLGELLRVDARQCGAEFGLLPVQLEALHYLSICNRYSDTPMAVSEYLGQTKGTVSQTLKVLEKKALLQKVADTADKRVTHLRVTEAGQQLLQQLIPSPMFAKACAHLSAAEQQQVSAALKLLLTGFLSANQMKSFGICRSCRHNSETEYGYFCNLLQQPLSAEDAELICKEHERQ